MTERRSIPSRNRRVPSRLLSPSPETINNATTTTTSTQSQAPSRSSTRSNAGVHSARQREDEVVEASLGKRKRRPSNMKELPATIASRSESFSPPAPGVNSSSTNQSLSTNPPIRLKLRVSPLNNPQQSSSSPSTSTRSTLPPVSESTSDSNPSQSISTAIARHSRFSGTSPQQHHSSLQASTSASSLNASSSYGHHDFSNSLGSGDLGGYDSDAGDATTALLRAQEPDYASDMDLEEQEERSCYNGNGAVDIRNGKSRSRRTTSTLFDPSSKKRSFSNSRNGPSRIKIKSHNRSISVNGLKSKDYSFEDGSSLDFSSSSTKSKSRIRSASMNVHKTSKLHHSRSQTQIEDVKNHKHLPSSSLSGSRLGHEEMGMDIVFEGMDDAEFNERDTLAYEGEESSDPEEDEEDDFHEAMLNGNDYDLEGGFSQSSRSEKAHFNGVGRFDFPSSKLNKSRNQHSERIEGSGSGSTTDIDAEDTPATTPRSPVSVGGELESTIDYSASKKASDANLSAQQGDPKSNNSSPSKSKSNLDASQSAPLATRTRSAVNANKKESLDKISIPVKSKSQAEPASTSSDLSSAASIRKGEAVFAHALPSPPKPRADAGKLFLSLPWGDNDEENDGQRRPKQEGKNGKDEAQESQEDGDEGEASVTEVGKKASARNTARGLQTRRNAATRHHSSFNESNSSATAVSTDSSTNTPSRSGTLQDSASNAEDKKGIASTSPLLSPSDSVRALHLHLNLGRPSSGLVGGMPSPSLLTPGLHRTSSGLGMGIGVDGDIVLSPSILKGKQSDGLKEPEALNLSESVEGNEKIESDEVEEELIGSSSTKETTSSSKPRLNSSSLKALQKPNTRTSRNETSNAGAEEGMEEDDSHSSLSAGSDWLQNARSVSADLSPTRADYQNEAEEEDMLHQFGRPEDMPLSELDLAWGVEAGEADDDLEMMVKKNGVSGELSTSAGTENESRRSRMNGSDSITPQKRSNASTDNEDKVELGGSSNQKVVQTRGRKSSKRTKS